MTCYQGGKKRIGKKIHSILSLINEDIYPDNKLPYFEPFVGMGSIIRHFGKEGDRQLTACDANIDLIMMWQALQKGWKPPTTCTRKRFEQLKNSKIHSANRCFIGIVASWGGIFFHDYRLEYKPDKDFMGEGYRGLMNIKPDIKNVKFLEPASYDTFDMSGFLIYCDPPYKGNNLKSDFFTEFDSEKFWEVMREWSKKNIVVISESIAPKDFKKIWCIESRVTNNAKTKRYQDCLFIHKDTWKLLSSTVKRKIKNIE